MKKGLFIYVSILFFSLTNIALEAQVGKYTQTKARKDYYDFLSGINWSDIDALSRATAEFEKKFASARAGECDSAYFILEEFATTCVDRVRFDANLLRSAVAKSTSEGIKYGETLNKNYYSVLENENGDIEVKPNLKAIRTRVSKNFSPSMKAFFAQVDAEEKQAYLRGETVLVSWQELSKRALFWEKFSINNISNIFKDEATRRRNAYLEILVYGTAQSPIYGSDGKLKSNIKDVYTQIQKGGDNGLVKRVIDKYMTTLEAAKFDCKAPSVAYFTY